MGVPEGIIAYLVVLWCYLYLRYIKNVCIKYLFVF